MTTHSRLTPAEFIQAWQTSETLAEVAEKTGLPKNNCYSRAGYYRTKGVPLKKITAKKKNPWSDLIELAASIQK